MPQGFERAMKFDKTTRWRRIRKRQLNTGKFGSLFTVHSLFGIISTGRLVHILSKIYCMSPKKLYHS